MRILGIETSHDDTSLAVINNGVIEAMVTYSQIKEHAKYGGVVPEIASREHAMNVAIVLEKLKSKTDIKNIDMVAFTKEPGLIGALHMGSLLAHGIAFALDVPIKPINHLVGHVFSCAIEDEIKYPALALLVSGGHTQLMFIESPQDIRIVGETQDDAIGETYDKIARKLQLGYPGGPYIDEISENYTPQIQFPIPMKDNALNFSFSGLKSHVINYIHNEEQKGNSINKKEIAAAFQEAAINSLLNKTKMAIEEFKPKSILLAGGVSANKKIRKEFLQLHENAIIPNLKYATDNGAMIAKAAEILFSK